MFNVKNINYHRLYPLIKKCTCGPRKEKYCCSQQLCNAVLCKRCYDSCQHDITSYIGSREDNIDDNRSGNNYSSETDNDCDSSESGDNDFNEDMFDSESYIDDHNRTHDNYDAILTHNNLDDFLTHAVPTEGMLDRPEEFYVD